MLRSLFVKSTLYFAPSQHDQGSHIVVILDKAQIFWHNQLLKKRRAVHKIPQVKVHEWKDVDAFWRRPIWRSKSRDHVDEEPQWLCWCKVYTTSKFVVTSQKKNLQRTKRESWWRDRALHFVWASANTEYELVYSYSSLKRECWRFLESLHYSLNLLITAASGGLANGFSCVLRSSMIDNFFHFD